MQAVVMSESEAKEINTNVKEKESKSSEGGGGEEFGESGLVEEGELDYDEEEEGEVVEGVKVKRKELGVNSDQLENNEGAKREINDNDVKESKSDLEEGELDDEDDLEEGELKDSIEEKPKQLKQDRNYRQGVRPPRRMHEMRPGRFRPMAPPDFGLPGPPFPQIIPPRPPPIGMTPGWLDGPPVRGGPMYGPSDRFRERSPKEESAWERGMKHVKEVLKAASLRKERQAQGHEGSASPQSAEGDKDDSIDKQSSDRGDSRYGRPKSPTSRQSDHRRNRLQYSGSHSSYSRDRRRRSLSSGSRSHSQSPSPRNHRNRRRSRSYSHSHSPNYRSMDRSRQPDEWKDPWRRSPSPSSGRRPMRAVIGRRSPSLGRRSPSPARRRRSSVDKDRERRSGGKRWRSRSRSVSRSRSLSREPDTKKRRASSPRRRSRSPRRRSSPSPGVSRHRREQSPREQSRHSRSRSRERSPSSDTQQSRQRDKRSPGLEVGTGVDVDKQASVKGKEAVGNREAKEKREQFSSISGSSGSDSSSHEAEVPPTKARYDAVSPVSASKVHGISPISSPDDLNKLRDQQKLRKEGAVEPLPGSQQAQHKGISFKLIGKKRWLKASTENVSPPETPTPTEVPTQPVPIATLPTASSGNSSVKAPNDQEATARKQRLLDELKAVEAAIARKKAKIKPPSQTQTTIHNR